MARYGADHPFVESRLFRSSTLLDLPKPSIAMSDSPDLDASLLERSIAQHEQRLATAHANKHTQLASRVQKNLDRLLEQQKAMSGKPGKKPSKRKAPKRKASKQRAKKVSRPKLKDARTVIDPRGERWMELVGYVQKLGEHFPNEYVSDRCGFFSTEGEFARYIRELESRIADAK